MDPLSLITPNYIRRIFISYEIGNFVKYERCQFQIKYRQRDMETITVVISANYNDSDDETATHFSGRREVNKAAASI